MITRDIVPHGLANPAQADMSDGNASAPPTTATRAEEIPAKCQNDGVVRSGRSHGRGEVVAADASGIAALCDRCSDVAAITRPRGVGDLRSNFPVVPVTHQQSILPMKGTS
jgi:hypothetical protein